MGLDLDKIYQELRKIGFDTTLGVESDGSRYVEGTTDKMTRIYVIPRSNTLIIGTGLLVNYMSLVMTLNGFMSLSISHDEDGLDSIRIEGYPSKGKRLHVVVKENGDVILSVW